MPEKNMEITPVHHPETESLPNEEQYKIAATMTLFDMMKQIGQSPDIKPNGLVFPDERSVLIELCMSVAEDVTLFETKINQRNQIGNGHLASICQGLQFTDERGNRTARYISALHYAKQAPDWAWHYQVNSMARFDDVQKEILPFLAPRVMPATNQSGPTLMNRLVDFHQQAEYWIGHYDQLDQES